MLLVFHYALVGRVFVKCNLAPRSKKKIREMTGLWNFKAILQSNGKIINLHSSFAGLRPENNIDFI
jgi:hypothetical protein